MFVVLQVITVFLVAVAMGLALAHALELPGKMRLEQEAYRAVQEIYYPGFTIGGISEPLAAVATLLLLLTTPTNHAAFWWIVTGFIALLGMQAVFWLMTQPVNRYWLKDRPLKGAGAKFFSVEPGKQSSKTESDQDWKKLRNKWEYSHLWRALFGVVAFVVLTVALVV